MANYATLKAAIQQVIKTNGNNEITGSILQNSLISMITSLGAGYQFVGVASTTTNPGTIDYKALYLASGAGTYTYFGLRVSEDELAVFVYGTSWSKLSVPMPTQVVKYTSQSLTDAQKAQARENIGVHEDYDLLYSYGVEFDTTVSSPTCTRIGNTDLHKSLPIQSKMRGCLLDDDGNVVKYLNASDWTSETRDGTSGQVMVEIPRHYRRCETDGTKRRVRISEYPLPGYTEVPLRYVSAYQATVDRTNSKLASVVNTTAQYRGGNNQSAWDGTYRSQLGRPISSINLARARELARNRKTGSYAWNQYTYGTHKAIYWLFVIEYATLNSQLAYNAQKTSEGYAQGGLGSGVTNWTWTPWSQYNGAGSFAPCGHTDTIGNGSGEVSLILTDADGATVLTTAVNRYRGVELPFGHLSTLTDGILVVVSGGEEKIYKCSEASSFENQLNSKYNYIGLQATSSGTVKSIVFGDDGELVVETVGASTTTYFCDYFYQSTSDGTRNIVFGGETQSGGYAGITYERTDLAIMSGYSYYGVRLCYLPTTD